MPFIYRLDYGSVLSIEKLRHALQLIIMKRESLRTSLYFNSETNQLMQRALDFHENQHKLFRLVQSTFQDENHIELIMHNEKRNSQLFDLSEGRVFRCHILRRMPITKNNDILSHKDGVIFNFHHGLFDSPSMDVFLHDLNEAYTTGVLCSGGTSQLRYIDCK